MRYGHHHGYRSATARHYDTAKLYEVRGPELTFGQGVKARAAVLWHEAEEAAEAVAEFVRRFGVRPLSVEAV